jgi:hypothetical protein
LNRVEPKSGLFGLGLPGRLDLKASRIHTKSARSGPPNRRTFSSPGGCTWRSISRFHNYLIYYEPRDDAVSVERILDGPLDVRRILEERLDEPLGD